MRVSTVSPLSLLIASQFWKFASSHTYEQAITNGGNDVDIVYVTVYQCLVPGAGPFTVVPGVVKTPAGQQGGLEVYPTSPAKSTGKSEKNSQEEVGGAQSTSLSNSEHGGSSGGNGGQLVNPISRSSMFGAAAVSATNIQGAQSTSAGQQGGEINGKTTTLTNSGVGGPQMSSQQGGGGPNTSSYASEHGASSTITWSGYSNHSSASTTSIMSSSTAYPTVTSPNDIINVVADGDFGNGQGPWDSSGNVTIEQKGVPGTGNTGNALLTTTNSASNRLRRRQVTNNAATISQTLQSFPASGIAAVYLYYGVDITAQPANATPENCKLDVYFGLQLLVSSGYFPTGGVSYTALTSFPLLLVGSGPLSVEVNCINGGIVAVRVDEIVFGTVSFIAQPTQSATTTGSNTATTTPFITSSAEILSATSTSSSVSSAATVETSTAMDISSTTSITTTTVAAVPSGACTTIPPEERLSMSPTPRCSYNGLRPSATPTASGLSAATYEDCAAQCSKNNCKAFAFVPASGRQPTISFNGPCELWGVDVRTLLQIYQIESYDWRDVALYDSACFNCATDTWSTTSSISMPTTTSVPFSPSTTGSDSSSNTEISSSALSSTTTIEAVTSTTMTTATSTATATTTSTTSAQCTQVANYPSQRICGVLGQPNPLYQEGFSNNLPNQNSVADCYKNCLSLGANCLAFAFNTASTVANRCIFVNGYNLTTSNFIADSSATNVWYNRDCLDCTIATVLPSTSIAVEITSSINLSSIVLATTTSATTSSSTAPSASASAFALKVAQNGTSPTATLPGPYLSLILVSSNTFYAQSAPCQSAAPSLFTIDNNSQLVSTSGLVATSSIDSAGTEHIIFYAQASSYPDGNLPIICSIQLGALSCKGQLGRTILGYDAIINSIKTGIAIISSDSTTFGSISVTPVAPDPNDAYWYCPLARPPSKSTTTTRNSTTSTVTANSTLATTTLATITSATTTSAITTSVTTTSATTTSSPVGCTATPNYPSSSICGVPGYFVDQPAYAYTIDDYRATDQSSVAACAKICANSLACKAFGFSVKSYSGIQCHFVDDHALTTSTFTQQPADTADVFTWYNVDCLSCSAAASSSTTIATSISPTSLSTSTASTISTSTTTSTTTTTTSCAITTSVSVTFNELRTTNFGQTVKIVGSDPSLGSWNTNNAVALTAYTYTATNPLWVAVISLPVGASIEYKFITVNSDGSVTWESDPNRQFSWATPTSCESQSTTIGTSWR